MTSGRPALIQDGLDVLLAVRVQPHASRNQVVMSTGKIYGRNPEKISLRVTAPPVEGAANIACRAFLAQLLGIAQSRILLVKGELSRNKLLRIRNADVSSVLARLNPSE